MANWTMDEYNALKQLIATGASEVSYGGPPARKMVARPQAEMLALLAEMEQQLNGDSRVKRTTGYMMYDRGA